MKKLLFILLFIPLSIFAQKVDKVIKTEIYTSYYSFETHTPLYVSYILYRGGGTVSRNGMQFPSKLVKEYEGSGYDIGHMDNAEDNAHDRKLMLITFDSINANPQTPKSNRGIWKSWESKIRTLSQKDSILIICGGYGYNNHLISNTKVKDIKTGEDRPVRTITNILIPDYCFKIYKDLKTKETHYLIFPNDNSDSYKEITPQQFLVLTKYNIKL